MEPCIHEIKTLFNLMGGHSRWHPIPPSMSRIVRFYHHTKSLERQPPDHGRFFGFSCCEDSGTELGNLFSTKSRHHQGTLGGHTAPLQET